MKLLTLTLIFAVTMLCCRVRAADESALPFKLVYISQNFMFEKNVNDVIKILERAAKAGYTGVALTDCKFHRWYETVTVKRPEYDNNVKRVRQACRDLKLACYVFAGDMGTDTMSVDPNLAEGSPVVDAPFVVKGGKLVPADTLALKNPSFEESTKPNTPAGWNADDPGTVAFLDETEKTEGKQSLRLEPGPGKNAHGNARLMQTVAVSPFRYYHVSVQVKTSDFEHVGSFYISAGGSQELIHQHFDIQPTQDWKTYDVVFNTLESKEVTLRIGSWGGRKGKIWIDNVKVEPGGFVNLIRREGCELKLTSPDGKTVYEEGKDVPEIKDPKMGNTDWPGLWKYWYEGPSVAIPQGSRLKEGDTVLASYNHAQMCYGYGVIGCMSNPKLMEVVQKNVREIQKVLQPDGYILPHDEIRHQGWCGCCVKSGKTPAKVLAENIAEHIAFIKKIDAGKPIFLWNDMVEPYHNAGKKDAHYYLVKGKDPWYNSWEGLDKDVIILNWHNFPENRLEAMKFFAERGHKQILCGFYDASSDDMIPWLKEAAQVKGIVGVMYTTWGNNFSELEKYLKVVETGTKK
ncbi:MAG TPA: carbohydrate binding domain-containing protein [Planctomycetota bacterium]|nr:carbohydrate binding domain-containing protein [Planctomycetota bacterium]